LGDIYDKIRQKNYVTSVENGSIHQTDFNLKYNDPEVLKFSLEDAKKIIYDNKRINEKLGMVNSKGIQLRLGEYDGVLQRV